MRFASVVLLVAFIARPCSPIRGSVTTFENRSAWQSAAGDYTTITFQGFPKHALITDQYAALGVLFPDGNDVIDYNDAHLNDGVGLVSSDIVIGTIHMTFAQPMTVIATDYLGIIDIQLYANGQLIYHSPPFFDTSGPFAGLISTVPFDAAVIRDPSNGVVVIDDLYFGPPIPSPGALMLFGLAAGVAPIRRARS